MQPSASVGAPLARNRSLSQVPLLMVEMRKERRMGRRMRIL
jgi:hypothetical protein